MSASTLLRDTDPRGWQIQQVVTWDWHDGPREGVCQFSHPPCTVFFRVMAEQWLLGKFGDRLVALQGVPDGTLPDVLSLWGVSAAPHTPVWAPHGEYESAEQRARIEAGIVKIMESADPEVLVVRSKDFESFDEVWLPVKA
ncbi:hypothetical protein WME79_34300 [Sorangium sp. So ce726]|uniref:hypothetical protein n=1 Tax=Sorangium sp. So ce726 TaxID=3133319 RepID=UPI003F5F8403